MIPTKKCITLLRSLGFAASLGFHVSAQTPTPTILTLQMENVVQYQENYTSLSTNGTSAVIEAPIGPASSFSPDYFIGDIATINGKKSKGPRLPETYL